MTRKTRRCQGWGDARDEDTPKKTKEGKREESREDGREEGRRKGNRKRGKGEGSPFPASGGILSALIQVQTRRKRVCGLRRC